jgi:hypothetical protein
MSKENPDVNAMNAGSSQPQPQAKSDARSVRASGGPVDFGSAVIDCINQCAEECGHPTRIDMNVARGANVAGPVADAMLIPAEKLFTELVVAQGPRVISMFFAFLRAKIPA